MIEKNPVQRVLERALAFAHAALEVPDQSSIAEARRYAAQVQPCLTDVRRFELTLGEARQIVVLMKQLRTILAALDARDVEVAVAL